jgi:hypothetical protein
MSVDNSLSASPSVARTAPIMLLPLGVILMNVKLFDVAGRSIQPIHVIVVLLVIAALGGRIRKSSLLQMAFYCLLPLCGVIEVSSKADFASSYAVYVLSCALIFIGIRPFLHGERKGLQRVYVLLFRMFNVTAAFGIVQFVHANAFHSRALYNILGRFQHHPHYPNELFGFHRATSVYIEPSVFAWVCTTVFVINTYLRHRRVLDDREYYLTLTLSVLGTLLTLSASGYIGFTLVLLCMLLVRGKRDTPVLVSLLATTALLLIVFVPSMLSWLRISTILVPGSSGYNRLVQPYQAMMETLRVSPVFGRGIGQIGVVDPRYVHNYPIHNSAYGIVVAFGLSALAYVVPVIRRMIIYIRSDLQSIPLFANLFYVFVTTGSFLSLELPVLYSLSTIAIALKTADENRYESRPTSTLKEQCLVNLDDSDTAELEGGPVVQRDFENPTASEVSL